MGIDEFYLKFGETEVQISNDESMILMKAIEIWKLNVEEFYYMTIEKENYIIENLQCGETCTPPTEAEIRDALLKECENYTLLNWPCKAAVEIAYLLR